MLTQELPVDNNTTENSNLELSMDEWYQICLERPDAFAHFYFKHILKFPSSRFHRTLYTVIRKINKSPYSNHIAIAAPRGNAKTQIMSVILPIWCAALEQKKHIVLISETGRQAEANLDSIRHELESNELLLQHFPHVCGEGPKWRSEVITTNNVVHIVALGSGKKIRGSQKLSERPDLVLADDLEGDEQVLTWKQREKLEEWFVKAVMGLAGPNAKMDIVVTGTILHPHSLLSKFLNSQKYPSWEQYKFKAVYKFSQSPLWRDWERLYTDHTSITKKESARAFFDQHKEAMLEETEVLWPDGEPYYNLMEYRINAGIRAFSSEKMNDPIDPSSCVFNIDKIVYFDRADLDINELIFYGAIDPASGNALLKGDLSAIITLAKDPKTGIIYVFDVWSGEKGVTDCIKYIKEMHKRYNYKKFGLDSDSLKLFKEFIARDIPSLENKLVLYDLRLKKTKRIDRLEPLIHDGTIRIQSNQYELIDELTFYPKSDHDDVLDALEIGVRLAGTRRYRLLMY